MKSQKQMTIKTPITLASPVLFWRVVAAPVYVATPALVVVLAETAGLEREDELVKVETPDVA